MSAAPGPATPVWKKVIDVLTLIGILFFCSIVIPLLFLALFPLSLLVLGLPAVAAGWTAMRRGWRSRSWSHVPGRILSCEVRKWDSGAGRSRSVTYAPRISYEYEVEGRRYEGHAVTTLESWGSRKAAERTAARFPPGSEVRVFLPPGKPADAVLIPGFDPWSVLILAVGLGVTGIALWFEIPLLRERWIVVRDIVAIGVGALLYWILRRRQSRQSKGGPEAPYPGF